MENIFIEGSEVYFTPEVRFDAASGVCEIAGESYLEETYAFYDPLYKWLKEYINGQKGSLTFNIKLRYMNTSSSKCILVMLKILKNYKDEGGKVIVNWFIDRDDDDMQEEVEDILRETEMPINSILE
jgi:hypothetical protein